MFWLVWFAALIIPRITYAQYQGGHWAKLEYTYANLEARSPGGTAESGQLPGARGELGFGVSSNLGISAGGEYADFRTTFGGTPIGAGAPTSVTAHDFARDMRAMGHFIMAPVVLSAGLAERWWSDQLPGFYTARTTYAYLPAQISYFFRYAYVTLEQDIWRSARARVAFSEGNSGASNAEFGLGGSSSYAAELGWLIPGALGTTRVFVRYQKWATKASGAFPDVQTTIVEGGIGIGF